MSEKSRENKSDTQDAPDRSPETETDEDEYLEDTWDTKNRKMRYALIAIPLGVIAIAGFLLWFMGDTNRKSSDAPPPNQQTEQTDSHKKSKAIDASVSPQKAKPPETTGHAGISEHTAFGVADKREKAARIRDKLLKKQEEIRALKDYYRNRIQEVTNEILNEKREKGIDTFQQALKNKPIELGLQTLRRRHLYINKLDEPLAQLYRGSEALRYIERLAEIQIQMAPIVKGIDIAEVGKHMDIIMEKEANGINSLDIDTRAAHAPSMEEIWEKMVHAENMKRRQEKENQAGESPAKEAVHSQGPDSINMEIWEEICAGNLSRKHKLTQLSLNAAKCLSQGEGKSLFLNNITELPASVAGELAQWEGEWLCLNGLTELSPEAAEGLSRWQGVRLSLNGLIELTPQAAKHLSQWSGKEIEAVGVDKISPEVDKYLAAWRDAGGKIYLRRFRFSSQ